MRSISLTVIVLFLLCGQAVLAQRDAQLLFNWDKRRPATYENFFKVIAASNGRIIAAGETLGPYNGDTDALFTVIDEETGREINRIPLGGVGDQAFHSVVQNFDGTFTLAGYTRTDAKSASQGWIVRLDLEGQVLFEKILPGKGGQEAVIDHLAINPDGIVLASGWQGGAQTAGLWLLQIAESEIKEYRPAIDGLGKAAGLTAGADGAFVLAGSTAKEDRSHPADAWVLKVDAEGRDLWSGPKYFGDKGWQEGRSITATSDGGYALAGSTTTRSAGLADKWLIKLNQNGDVAWERTLGGHADDIATNVVELSEGGYAILGQTWSNLPRARYSTLELVITDELGNELDDNTYAIRQVREEGHEKGQSLVEGFSGDLIMVGTSYPEKEAVFPACQVSAVIYRSLVADLERSQKEELYSNTANPVLGISSVAFFDANNNQLLESEERGYVAVKLTNRSHERLDNVSGLIAIENQPDGLTYWETIKIGTIRAGQQKKLIVPVAANRSLSAGVYELNIELEVDGVSAGSAVATLESNRPEPPKLLAEGVFNPADPKPGETVTLGISLVNAGGRPTAPMSAQLTIPPGLNFFGSDRQQVEAIAPNERRDLIFSFSYDQNYPAKSLDFRFEAEGADGAMLAKTFRLNIGNQPPPAAVSEGYMAWVSHEPKKEAIDVNNRQVNLKVVTIAKTKLEQEKFSILINGKRVEGQKMDEAQLTPPGERNDQYYSNTILLKEGPNKVQVVYEGGNSPVIASPIITFNYLPLDKPNLYVLTIGVPYDNLQYTVKDASDIANAYLALKETKGRVFKEINVYPIVKKEDATTLNIKKAFVELENLRRIKNGDLVIVFISSHGKITHDNQFILIPSDYEPGYESLTSINFETDILNRLRNVPGNKLVFIDACHSGKATLGSKYYNTDAAASKLLNDLLQATAGLEIFASCGDNEYSYEDERWGNGAFTKAIIEAFNNETVAVGGKSINADILADNPETGVQQRGSDGVITIGELKTFIQQRVPYLVRTVKDEAQHPHNRSTDLLPENTGIYMVKQKGN